MIRNTIAHQEGDRGSEGSRNRAPRRPGTPRGTPPRRPPLPGGRPFRTLAFWAFVALLSLVAFRMYQGSFMAPQRIEISYTRFIQEVDKGNIQDLQIIEKLVTGELRGESSIRIGAHDVPFKAFKTNILGDGADLPERVWKTNPGIEVEVRNPSFNWVSVLVGWLPVVFVLVLWLFMVRQVQSGGSAALKFGKTKARVLLETAPKVTFKDVAGCDEAKQELQEVIEFLKEPQKFQRLGGRIPKGALLLGPPGSGKTLLAKAVAGEAGVPFFSMSGSDFVEMFVGVGASVTGDTPVLIREDGATRLTTIGEFVDRFHTGDDEGHVVPVEGVETLGFEERDSKFKGSPKTFVKGSAWSRVRGAYRHRVSEICEIHFLGGVIRTTADHSVFVRTRDGIKPVAAAELDAGDVLVGLPFKVRGEYSKELGTPHSVRAHSFTSTGELPVLDVWERHEESRSQYEYALAHQGQISQAAIAGTIGVSQMTVSNWQRGRHEPRAISSGHVHTRLPERVPVTTDLMRLLGYYTAEGRENGCLEFTFGTHETDLHADCIARMKRVFGVDPKVRHTEDHSTKITYHVVRLGRFFARHCGTGSHEKHMPEVLWDLPREHFDAFLTGYALGDGYTTREGKLSITSVSHRLIRELTWLCAMHGIKAGVRRMRLPAGRVIKSKPLPETVAWNLIIGKTSHPFRRDSAIRDQAKKPIVRRVVRKPYEGYVYDLCGCDGEAFFGGDKPVLLHNSRVRDLFEQGKRNAPCIVFVDEIDAVGRHRGAGLGGGHDEREQTLNQLLVEMDGFESNEGVIMIAATNRPDVLDPALLRPGRFDRQIVVDWPDVRGREGILRVHTRKIPLAEDVDLKMIARSTPGLAGADLANIVNESALLAARRNRKKVTQRDFEDAKDKVMLGMERRSLVMTEEERRSTAYHEAGHALVGWLLPGSDPVNKVTIIPRGRALGITSWVPQEERHNRSKEDLERMLCHMMGGRAAELLIFNHLTTGAISDIEQATETARNMVCRYGMSDALGPLTFGKKEEMVFLGKEIATHKDYSEQTAVLIDQEVRRIIETAYNNAQKVLRENVDKLHLLANTLLEREVLDGDEMDRVLRGEKLEPLRPAVEPELTAEAAATADEGQKSAPGEKLESFPPPAPRPAGA
ncbi:MAG TPA: ATP-dependent metallopeptidase FtsH/Yme1/Tma family protein [Candidatus Eisenbacteria bacterium]